MAFIVGKKQVGKTYYYLAESARVDGKPRIVSQRYLGSAEEIAARPHGRPAHGAPGRPSRAPPERPGAPVEPRGHRRDRPALSRRTGAPPCPAHAHRDRRHPATPLRPVQSGGPRPAALT